MDAVELAAIVAKHKLWLENKEGGQRAHLQDADLQDADLRSTNLQDADLPVGMVVLDTQNIGSRDDTLRLVFHPEWWSEGYAWTGCFAGSLPEFEAAVNATHPDCEHGENYRRVIKDFREKVGNNG